MLIAHGIEKSFAAQAVLGGVSFTLNRGEKVGLVGRNGCGKTTLIRILAGVLRPDRGSVQRSGTIGHLPQSPDWPAGSAALDVAMSSGCQDWRARRVLGGLVGCPPEQVADTLSGGEKTRLLLARALLGEHDVLLLDEPTNHLDIAMLEFVEEIVRERKGAVLCVSHDRRFLDNTVSTIVELDGGKVRSFRGGYRAYQQAKDAELRRREALYIDHQKQVRLLSEFVRRQFERARSVASGPKAGRDFYGGVAKRMAKRARAAERRLEQLEPADKPRHAENVRFELAGRGGGHLALEAAWVGKRFGDRWVLRDVSLSVALGERIGIVGPNGSGKSTLLKLLLVQMEPSEGSCRIGPSVTVAYSAQEQENLGAERMVLDELRTVGGIDETSARALLACFLFRQDDVFKRVEMLSMGERARLALAKASLSGANLLVLDEPTNYLDIPACERLESALESYDGTLLVVSHDRYLLDRLCPKWLWVADGDVRVELR